MWQQLAVPAICERMIGFSVPQNATVLVVSYEGMHLVRLNTPITVETDEEYFEYDLFNHNTGIAEYRGREWNIIGLYPGHPTVATVDGELLQLDTKAKTVYVVKDGKVIWQSKFKNFSGDWVATTFSLDGRYIVLGCPYDFDFRVWERLTIA